MEVAIIKIGNSKGLRLSKTILERYNIKDKVEILFEKGHIVLKPISKPRSEWAEAFKHMRENDDDVLLLNEVYEDEDIEEWE